MNNSLKSRLSAIAVSVKSIGGFFSGPTDVLPPTQQNRINGAALGSSSQQARWVEGEKFVNLKKMKVQTPEGFKSTYIEYLADLEAVWAMISKLDTDLLKPLSIKLASLANDPKELRIPNSFRSTDIKSTLLGIEPNDYVKKLARHFDGTSHSQVEFGKVYRNANDVDVIATRVLTLNEQIDTTSRRQISRMIETISTSAAELSDVVEIAPQNSKALNDVLYRTAQWVELLGVFMLQASALHESIVNTAEKIDRLSKK